jgi:RimJ/RimL family protein N-acetyltransferase
MTCYENVNGPFVHPIVLHNGENIGYIQAVQIDEGWEIGYHIAKAYTGNGYSVEAVKAFLPVLFRQLNINKIYGICLSENIASQKVLEKCNFKLEHKGMEDYQSESRMIYRYVYSI